MTPRHEIGGKLSWSAHASVIPVPIGTEVVVERGSAAVFFGEVIAFRPVGSFKESELRVRLTSYFYKDQPISVVSQRFKWFDFTPRTYLYTWNKLGVAAPPNATYTCAPDPRASARAARAARAAAEAEVNSRRNARKAYVAHRDLLKNGRDELSISLSVLNTDPTIDMEEFKRIRKSFLLEWHPDREVLFVNSGGLSEFFKQRSSEVIHALAFVENYIKARNRSA